MTAFHVQALVYDLSERLYEDGGVPKRLPRYLFVCKDGDLSVMSRVRSEGVYPVQERYFHSHEAMKKHIQDKGLEVSTLVLVLPEVSCFPKFNR